MEAHAQSSDSNHADSLTEPIRQGTAGKKDLKGADLSGKDLRFSDLSGADLTEADLTGANLFRASLTGALLVHARLDNCELTGADLSSANMEGVSARSCGLGMAKMHNTNLFNACLEDSTLTKADLSGADLRCAALSNARLREANLSGADFTEAEMSGCDLSLSDTQNAIFSNATMSDARLRLVRNYEQARWIGVDLRNINFSGSYMMKRYIMDENYIKEFKESSRMNRAIYYLWWLTSNCGRSLTRWIFCIAAQAIVFALIYPFVGVDYGSNPTVLSPLYFSVVTLTTLGYGDVVPSTVSGQILAMIEVCTGYIMLGGLLSIFSNKLARRAE